jgi:hypothetical protein
MLESTIAGSNSPYLKILNKAIIDTFSRITSLTSKALELLSFKSSTTSVHQKLYNFVERSKGVSSVVHLGMASAAWLLKLVEALICRGLREFVKVLEGW